jgi:very-short-patch-repair endonuclease
MTDTERMLWTRLRRNGVGPQFRRQQIIYGFVADFYCHSAALAIEIDSPSHDPEYDRERDRIFAEHGIRVLRFTNDDVRNRIGWVLAQIKADMARFRGDDQ